MKPEVIEIYDTTLRDGSQGEGVNFSVADKVRIAERLDSFGVHYIEGGFPGSNPKDIEFFQLAKRKVFKNAKLCAFGSTRRKNIAAQDDDQLRTLAGAETPGVTIYGKTWMLHVTEVLGTTADENLAMIASSVRWLKDQGRMVIYDAEHAFDGYKDNPEYALATWEAAQNAGADIIVLCDTNGGCMPGEVARIVRHARERLTARVGIHSHNDCGLGVANAIAAIEAGATHAQGTVNGYGERIGNCNLTTLIPNIALKLGLPSMPDASIPQLKEVSQFVDEIANIRHDCRQPWVGGAAFAHKGGSHVNAVQKVIHSYEHATPESVGNKRRILISDLSGRSNIVMKAKEFGFDLTAETPELKAILNRVKELEYLGYEFEAAEGSLALLIRKMLRHEQAPFKVDAYHVSLRRDGQAAVCEATVKVRIGDKRAHSVADGDGPVNALDSALRSALIRNFPEVERLELTDYKVRIIDGGSGTAARTRVLLQTTDGKEEWTTVGVSENIVEASLQALVDSVEYGLLKSR